jgi:hypothetical protein
VFQSNIIELLDTINTNIATGSPLGPDMRENLHPNKHGYYKDGWQVECGLDLL